MGLANNGENYHRLRQSLRRLYLTSVIVGRKTTLTGTQRAPWDNVGVRFFEGIRYRDADDDGELNTLDGEATLSIRFGEQLAASIRAGIRHVLDGALLNQLEQPPARALYRTLQAHRLLDDGNQLSELRVPLQEWRQAVGITTNRTDLVRRALDAAHQELLANNYLKSAAFEGRGQKAVAVYEFTDLEAPDPALVILLRQAGVTVARAAALASRHPDRVEDAVRFLEHRRKSGSVRNPGGFVADFLENPDKYDLPAEFVTPDSQREERLRLAQERQRAVDQAARRAADDSLAQLELRSPAEQWEAQRSALRVLLKKHLNAEQWHHLERLVLEGAVNAVHLTRSLAAASVASELPEKIASLKRPLNPLLPQEG